MKLVWILSLWDEHGDVMGQFAASSTERAEELAEILVDEDEEIVTITMTSVELDTLNLTGTLH